MSPLFAAAYEAAEEAVYNCLVAPRPPMQKRNGRGAPRVPGPPARTGVSLLDLIAGARTITVVPGLAKNAGKTTVINHLLARLPGRVGLASLGLDGETRDQLTGLRKPRILPPRGALVATAEGLLEPGTRYVRCCPSGRPWARWCWSRRAAAT